MFIINTVPENEIQILYSQIVNTSVSKHAHLKLFDINIFPISIEVKLNLGVFVIVFLPFHYIQLMYISLKKLSID